MKNKLLVAVAALTVGNMSAYWTLIENNTDEGITFEATYAGLCGSSRQEIAPKGKFKENEKGCCTTGMTFTSDSGQVLTVDVNNDWGTGASWACRYIHYIITKNKMGKLIAQTADTNF